MRFINAWKAGRKLGSKLISYSYPKPTLYDTTGNTAQTIDAGTTDTSQPDTGTSDTGTPGTSTPDTGADTATAGSSDNERSISDGSYAAVVEIHSASHHTSHSDEPCEGETSQ